MSKSPVISSSTENRMILNIRPSSISITKREKSISSQIPSKIKRANELIHENINNLNKDYPIICPHITGIQTLIYQDDKFNLLRKINENNLENCLARICITVRDVSLIDGKDQLKVELSHFVETKIQNSNLGWHEVEGFPDVLVNIQIEDLDKLIHDILLDIAMFKSYKILEDEIGSNLKEKQLFSKKKVKFAIENKLVSSYGIIEPNAEYYSLASSCWKNSEFNINQYVTLWTKFIDDKLSVKLVKRKSSKKELLKKILLSHPQSGQLNINRIGSVIEKLSSGYYLILLTREKPKRVKIRKEILTLFKRKKWRTNLLKIIEVNKFGVYSRYYPYITFYKLEV